MSDRESMVREIVHLLETAALEKVAVVYVFVTTYLRRD